MGIPPVSGVPPFIYYHHQLTSQIGNGVSILEHELCYVLIARSGATLATRNSPDPVPAKARTAGVKTTPLIVDSGATVSIVNYRKLLANIREIPPTTVGGIGKQALIAHHKGDHSDPLFSYQQLFATLLSMHLMD